MTFSPVPKPSPRPKKARRPIPRINPVRAAKQYARDYGPKGDWVRRLPCCCTGKRTGEGVRDRELGMVSVVIVAAHFPGRGAGGHSTDLVPMADHLHTRGHQQGTKTLEQVFGVSFKQLAAEYEARWQTVAPRA